MCLRASASACVLHVCLNVQSIHSFVVGGHTHHTTKQQANETATDDAVVVVVAVAIADTHISYDDVFQTDTIEFRFFRGFFSASL